MKITIFELLKLIKEEKQPKEIKYGDYILDWDETDKDYYCEEYGNLFEYLFSEYQTIHVLNIEVTIVTKITIGDIKCADFGTGSLWVSYGTDSDVIKKLDIKHEKNRKDNYKWKVCGKEHDYNISMPQKIIADKVNEIIDYINKEQL